MADTEKADRSAGGLLVLAAEIADSHHALRDEIGDATELTRDQERLSARLMGLCEGFGLAVAEPHLTEMYVHGGQAKVAAIALDIARMYAEAGELFLETVDAADESGATEQELEEQLEFVLEVEPGGDVLAKLRAARDSFGGSS